MYEKKNDKICKIIHIEIRPVLTSLVTQGCHAKLFFLKKNKIKTIQIMKPVWKISLANFSGQSNHPHSFINSLRESTENAKHMLILRWKSVSNVLSECTWISVYNTIGNVDWVEVITRDCRAYPKSKLEHRAKCYFDRTLTPWYRHICLKHLIQTKYELSSGQQKIIYTNCAIELKSKKKSRDLLKFLIIFFYIFLKIYCLS